MAEKDIEKAAPAEEKKASSAKKPSFFARFGAGCKRFFGRLGKFFKGFASEFKKVRWAPVKATTKNALIVLGVTVVLAAVIGLLDLGLSSLIAWIGDLI